MLVGCLTSQQHASVSHGWICSNNFACCHTEIEVADQTLHLTQLQYTDTGQTSPSTDPITPGAQQDNHLSAHFYVTGMTRPRTDPGVSGIRTPYLPLPRWSLIWERNTSLRQLHNHFRKETARCECTARTFFSRVGASKFQHHQPKAKAASDLPAMLASHTTTIPGVLSVAASDLASHTTTIPGVLSVCLPGEQQPSLCEDS